MRNRKLLCVLVVALALVNLVISVGYSTHIVGRDSSNRRTATHVMSSTGETLAVFQEGESLVVEGNDSLVIVERAEMGWMTYPVNPKPYLKVSLKKFWAAKHEPQALFVLTVLGSHLCRRVIVNNPPGDSPWHLPLGTSWMTAVLRAEGHEVLQRYGHIIGLEYVLKQHDQWGWMIDHALCIVRDTKSGPISWHTARNIFEMVSSSLPTHGDRCVVARNNITYASPYHDGTIEGALETIRQRDRHLWYDYFRNVEIPQAIDFQPDIYGIAINTERQFIQGLVLASMIREALPDTLVVLGGNFWSRVTDAFRIPKFASFFNHCDAIVYREGFQPFKELVATLNPATTSGTAWRKDGEVVVNPPTNIPANFETLPVAAFDGGARQWSPDIVVPIQTESNCPMACGYCAISGGSDTFLSRPRSMSPRRIAEHMVAHGTHRFDVVDELFSIRRQLALGKELKKLGYTATWQCYTTITNDLLDSDVCRQLHDAGCHAIQLGLESLSPETLSRERKQWNHPENYGQILANLKEAGIQTHIFLILGLPGEPLHWNLRWLPFLERYGDSILTIKAARYRLARLSPNEGDSTHSQFIEMLLDQKPLRLDADFRYLHVSRKRVEVVRDILEQACREHWAYAITSTIPWWINRGRYSLDELWQMARHLPKEEPVAHLEHAVAKMNGIIREELGRGVSLHSFDDLMRFSRTI